MGNCSQQGRTNSAMKRNWRDTPIVRSWVATVKYKDDPAGYFTITTNIHGSNPTDAENAYLREHPDVAALVIRQENR